MAVVFYLNLLQLRKSAADILLMWQMEKGRLMVGINGERGTVGGFLSPFADYALNPLYCL
jgi:hypothetical protein